MTGRDPGRPSARPERELVEAVAAEFQARGYRTYRDPDGTDYFDLAVRREGEVGLIEGKVADARAVLAQALRRRPWADWVAVALGSERAAAGLVRRTQGRRASLVGVWCYAGGRLRELRPATPSAAGSGIDAFRATRTRFLQHLVDRDRGVLPAGVRWSNVASAVRRASAGRGFAEWRLDELDDRQP